MKKLLTLTIILLQAAVCSAQMDIELQRLSKQAANQATKQAQQLNTNARRPATEVPARVRAIAQIKADARLDQITSKLTDMGVKVMGDYGRIGILNVPVNKLQAVSNIAEIEYLSADRKNKVQNDRAREYLQIDTVQNLQLAQEFGLTDTYDGTGVLVGVIDMGIDFSHAAFRDKDGNTRVRMATIYNEDMGGEEPADMEACKLTFTSPEAILAMRGDGNNMSHGSHTSCTAAGSPVTLTDSVTIQGMAPGADLLLSGIFSSIGVMYDSYIIDAIYSQIKYAEEAGMPIVINLSLGSTTLFRDGKDPIITMCESMAGPGKVICFAAGNSGSDCSVIDFTPESDTDTLRTIIEDYYKYKYGVMVEIANEDDTPFQVRFGCIDHNTKELLPFEYYTRDSIPEELTEDDVLYFSNDSLHDNRSVADIFLPNGYAVACDSSICVYIEVIGQAGKELRLVSSRSFAISNDWDSSRFVKGSGMNSHSSSCETDSVISVGSYMTRPLYYFYNGTVSPPTGELGHPSFFTSYGTTKSGKCIPDVLAPGHHLLSAFNAYDREVINRETEEVIDNNIYGYSEMFGRKSWYGYMCGTSMACPATSGTIALWLQADPTLGPAAVREIMRKTSDVTPELENYPSIVYGSGILRAAAGLKLIEDRKRGIPDCALPVPDLSKRPMRIYNLSGQPVAEPVPGSIYIIDGQKVIK